jgi:hypothetical protein
MMKRYIVGSTVISEPWYDPADGPLWLPPVWKVEGKPEFYDLDGPACYWPEYVQDNQGCVFDPPIEVSVAETEMWDRWNEMADSLETQGIEFPGLHLYWIGKPVLLTIAQARALAPPNHDWKIQQVIQNQEKLQ